MTLEDFLTIIESNVPALDAIDNGEWNENTGSLLLSEDQWGAILRARDNLRAAVQQATTKSVFTTRKPVDEWIDAALARKAAE